jgi:hypothetical protein
MNMSAYFQHIVNGSCISAENIVLGFSYSMIYATKSDNMCKAKFDSSSIEEQ